MHRYFAGLALAGALASGGAAQALTTDEVKSIAMDAYVYGYSLITTNVTRVQMSNVAKADALHAPLGQFINVPRYPPGDYRGVSAPNADTLYSVVWVDLAEPQVLSHPDMGERYYLLPMYSLWMPVIDSLGSRTTGGAAADVLLTGPGWTGTVPEGMTHVTAPSRYMLMLGRIYADGTEADYKIVNDLQAQMRVTPLSAWGTDYTPEAPPVIDPGFSMTDAPQNVLLDLGTEGYFNMMTELMCKDAPPAPEDAPLLARIAEIGIVPCETFDLSALDAEAQEALETLPQDALTNITAHRSGIGRVMDGWIANEVGAYGTNYMNRAVIAAYGWPANLPRDAIYPYTQTDSEGETLNGANKYTLTFAKGAEPPVKGFWSITMYEIDNGWWFVPNELDKFTVSPRNDLKPNADGSVTLYFQTESPGAELEANWLPAPEGDFIPMLRMYWPTETDPSILDGSWSPPRVMKVD